jgi:hypothetical protein
MSQLRVQFVLKLAAVYTLATPACARGVTALDHEVTDDAVELQQTGGTGCRMMATQQCCITAAGCKMMAAPGRTAILHNSCSVAGLAWLAQQQADDQRLMIKVPATDC